MKQCQWVRSSVSIHLTRGHFAFCRSSAVFCHKSDQKHCAWEIDKMDELEISPSCKDPSLEQRTRTNVNLCVFLPNLSSQCFLGVLFWGTSERQIFQRSFCVHSSVGDSLRGTMTLLGEPSNLPQAPLHQHCWQGYRVKSDKRDWRWNGVWVLVCFCVSFCVCVTASDTGSACSSTS